MTIQRLLYTSRSTAEGEGAGEMARSLAARSAVANAARGLTGVLLHVGHTFIQVLEGPADALEAVFERICRDPRHRDVRLLSLAVATERLFDGWSMAFLGGEGGSAHLDLAGELEDVRFAAGVNAAEAMRRMRELVDAHAAQA